MPKKAAVFEETYNDYLEKIAGLDLLSCADKLGGELSGNTLKILLCAEACTVSGTGIFDAAGKRAGFSKCILLCRYLLGCPEDMPRSGGWAAYRDFRDAAPLIGYFTANVNQEIERVFSGKVAVLKDVVAKLGGSPFEDGSDYDLSMTLNLLPRIPALIRFNDKDDDFPAQASVLFRESAGQYLDMESLAIGGALLADTLSKKGESSLCEF